MRDRFGKPRFSDAGLPARMSERISLSKTSIVTHSSPSRRRAGVRGMRMAAGDRAFSVLAAVDNSAKDAREPEIRQVRGIQPDPTARARASPAASRMRRSRERRRRGDAIVSLEIRPSVITDLVALGWLPESNHADKGAIARAAADLIERAILARARPCADSQARTSFVFDLPPTTVDTLVALRWLPAGRAGDRDEIMAAFRRFAGRALGEARHGAVDLWNLRRA